LAASCADTVVTGDSAAPSTARAIAHARQMMFVVLIGIFEIAHELCSACLPICGSGTE
jgi:hypothetical protein